MKNEVIISGQEEEEIDQNSGRSEKKMATANAVINLARMLDVKIDMRDIVTAHRLAVRRNDKDGDGKIPRTIARVVYDETKKELMVASRKKKLNGIYCNDHLSSYTWE